MAYTPQNGAHAFELSRFDPLPEIIAIIRDAIDDGLLKISRGTFEHNVHTLSGVELEEYLQEVWDNI